VFLLVFLCVSVCVCECVWFCVCALRFKRLYTCRFLQILSLEMPTARSLKITQRKFMVEVDDSKNWNLEVTYDQFEEHEYVACICEVCGCFIFAHCFWCVVPVIQRNIFSENFVKPLLNLG
jgi:hypothetical protein